MNFIRIRLALLRGLSGLGFFAFSALAQPTLGPRPIKVVVPVAAGGGADQGAGAGTCDRRRKRHEKKTDRAH